MRTGGGGKPAFPTPSLIGLSCQLLIESLQDSSYRTSVNVSKVRKAGLPLLLR